METTNFERMRAAWGGVDVHLLHVLMTGRLDGVEHVLDLGAGKGRNGLPFWEAGCALTAVDAEEQVFAEYPRSERCVRRVGAFEEMVWVPEHDLVIACAVLHFARDRAHWKAMAQAAWSAVAPGGVLFVRTASTVGLADIAPRLEGGGFTVGRGERPFLVGAEAFLAQTHAWQAHWLQPLRTSVVEGGRCMTTWILEKPMA